MSGPTYYSNGIGGTTGAYLAKLKPLSIACNDTDPLNSRVIYVHYSGSNSNSGYERNSPVASLAYVLASMSVSPNGIICVLAGHKETIQYNASPVQTPSEYACIIGEGDGDQMPYFDNQADTRLFGQGGNGGTYINLRFGAAVAKANFIHAYAQKGSATAGDTFIGCKFEFGQLDQAPAGYSISMECTSDSSGATRFVDCSFESVSPYASVLPAIGIDNTNGTASKVCFDNCTFDGGQYGWNGAAVKLKAGAYGIESFQATRIKLLNGSDINLTNSSVAVGGRSAGGFVNVSASDGSSSVIW